MISPSDAPTAAVEDGEPSQDRWEVPVRRRWLIASVATVTLVTGTAVAAVAVRDRQDGSRAAGPAVRTAPAADATTGAPAPGATPAAATAQPAAATEKPSAAAATTRPATAAATQPAAGTAPLAGRIKPGVTYRGVATWYDTDGRGACGYDAGGDTMTAAMNWSDYEGSKACGAYVRVRSSTGAAVTVRITNECPSPCRVHQLDLSPQAFAKLAEPRTGQISVTWKLLSPAIGGGVAVRYKVGSSRYWCGIQVINHRNPVARLEVRSGGAWRRLTRAGYNYFLSPDGTGCGSKLRITDIYRQRLAVAALPIRPDTTQRTSSQFARH
jgi:expansin (peptidoglycan-binding protein)